jgi:hypothetical protein
VSRNIGNKGLSCGPNGGQSWKKKEFYTEDVEGTEDTEKRNLAWVEQKSNEREGQAPPLQRWNGDVGAGTPARAES